MKKLLLVIAVLFCGIALYAKPPAGWTDDYDEALEIARKEKKHVYVLFTGSDWCHWCIELRKDVLTKSTFKRFANKHLVLVYCDFPRKNNLSSAQRAKQQRWAQQLGAGRGVPCAVVVDSNGKVAGKISGYAPLKSYMKRLEAIVK